MTPTVHTKSVNSSTQSNESKNIIVDINDSGFWNYIYNYEGYTIKLGNNQYLKFGIDSINRYCETFGSKIYYDCDVNKIIGSEILNVKINEINDDIHNKLFSDINNVKYFDRDFKQYMTLSIYTSVGIILMGVYLFHNGDYPHKYYYEYNDVKDCKNL